MYYRYSNNQSPMSDWGHAMFVNNPDDSRHYGSLCYTFDGISAINVQDLTPLIVKAWTETKRTGYSNVLDDNDYTAYFVNTRLKDFIALFNPVDIVDSAAAYDDTLVLWLWTEICEPNNIMAIATNNGAIVFDENLIQKAN